MINRYSFTPHLVAYHLARLSIVSTSHAGSGHPTSCLSLAPCLAVLAGQIANPDDVLVLSKGHAAPILYSLAVLQGRSTESELVTQLRQYGSPFQGHPVPESGLVPTATGSLGQGLAIGMGYAHARHLQGQSGITYIIMGDAECAEGSVWEAVRTAPLYHLTNLVLYIDYNGHGQLTKPRDTPERLQQLFIASGWDALLISGSDYQELQQAYTHARQAPTHKPVVVIGITPKGYPISWLMADDTYHGKVVPAGKLTETLKELAHAYQVDPQESCPRLPPTLLHTPLAPPELKKSPLADDLIARSSARTSMSVREAVGLRIAQYAEQNDHLLVFDADVGNSTYMEYTRTVAPCQFVEVSVAEQLMVSMAAGSCAQGYVSVASTFAAFFTRAHDQLRMAAISHHPLICVGTHAGVSIGADGPSQMGLEDIALFAGLPESIILYPSDAMSAALLVDLAGAYREGIAYIRATRATTPILYSPAATIKIGGCFVHLGKQEYDRKICIITAGITLHEALKAQEQLYTHQICATVIDLYSVKPFDTYTVDETIAACNNHALIVEDHYQAGGIGQIVMSALAFRGYTWKHLYVTRVPSSGSPEQLLAEYSLDAAGIVQSVRELIS